VGGGLPCRMSVHCTGAALFAARTLLTAARNCSNCVTVIVTLGWTVMNGKIGAAEARWSAGVDCADPVHVRST
jgi:hypothetical protein